MGSHIEHAFDNDFKFTASNGLFVAAAFTAYDGETEVIEEARYGEMSFEYVGWGNGEEFADSEYYHIDYDWCTEEQLGLVEGPNTEAFPIFKQSMNEVKTWKKKFKCPNRDQLQLWGDYNSAKAQNLVINWRWCSGDNCAPVEEARDWLRNKYIVLLYNQISFQAEGFYENAALFESRIEYIPISRSIRSLVPYKIAQTRLELQDTDLIEINEFTLDERDDLFTLALKPVLPYEKDNNVQMQVRIEVDPTLAQFERNIYTVFDLLSDVGGLTGIFSQLFMIIIAVWNFHVLENYMV